MFDLTSAQIKQLSVQIQQARASGDFHTADNLRDQLLQDGRKVSYQPDGKVIVETDYQKVGQALRTKF